MQSALVFWLLTALPLTFSVSAEAQQPTKVPRIGYLSAASPSANAARIEAFRQGLRELGYVEGKTLSLSGDIRGKTRSPPCARRRASASQGRRHCHSWFASSPCRQGSNCHDSHCDDTGWRSCRQRVRRQPGAAWRKHHRIVRPCPGVKRKTTGAFEGDRS